MPEKKQPIISMHDAVKLLGLTSDAGGNEPIPEDVETYNIFCPQCGSQHDSRRRTCNLNFEENIFGCPRCGFSGGVYKLVSVVAGWPYAEVERRIREGMKTNSIPMADKESSAVTQAKVIAPLRQRDEVYRAFLQMLRLNDEHYNNLISRGFQPEQIESIGFKSLPKYMDPTVIPKRMVEAGLDLRGVPGFGINSKGERSIATLRDGGFLIPMRNGAGLIQGMQIRFDHPSDDIPKYGYFTSSGMVGGAKSETWCSYAGEPIMKSNHPFDILIIEGPLKAYLVNAATKLNVIAVPGVSALKKIPAALESMKKYGLRLAYVAYDMDSQNNPMVASALEKLREVLSEKQIRSCVLRWNSDYKGLDDWIAGPDFDEFRGKI